MNNNYAIDYIKKKKNLCHLIENIDSTLTFPTLCAHQTAQKQLSPSKYSFRYKTNSLNSLTPSLTLIQFPNPEKGKNNGSPQIE